MVAFLLCVIVALLIFGADLLLATAFWSAHQVVRVVGYLALLVAGAWIVLGSLAVVSQHTWSALVVLSALVGGIAWDRRRLMVRSS